MTDPTLCARIVARTPLLYTSGACEEEDRPAFVRAASGIAWVGDRLAILQDDASFIALLAPSGALSALPLPRGDGGRRRFEDRLGNRLMKLDLEACVALDGARLLALGSGSLPIREVAVLADLRSGEVTVRSAAAVFEALRVALGLGQEPANVEGAVLVGRRLRLFQRGVTSASVDFDVDSVLDSLEGERAPEVAPHGVRRYDLGRIGGVPFGFTDASVTAAGSLVFLAAAEDTDHPVTDGAVLGSRFGVIAEEGVRLADIAREDGGPILEKAEGIAPHPTIADRFLVVLDPDDAERPSELCELAVSTG